ncbi:MAG TPA: DUF488 domain-containing protein [Thiohalobacter sp.]|nr:DUF488 domain-containing protein [Thiohalobacter sp.]
MSKAGRIHLARVYDKDAPKAGALLLVDRIWPRGIKKAELGLDAWVKDVAPSSELRKWFSHDPEKWPEFQRRYRAELDNSAEAVEECLAWCRKGPVTLLYGAKDREHNQAVVLRDYLLERLKKGGS